MKNFTLSLLLIFALGVTTVMAQGRTVSGKVTDSGTGVPVVGAMVVVAGSQNGAYTMEGGEFIITNVNGAVNLEATFMGYTEETVAVSASQTNVNITLTPSAMQMDEVVVVAYGNADKKSLTGSVAVISADAIKERPITNIASAISGMSPGIQTTTSGGPEGIPTIRIRGIGSINSSSTPLYVVDGIPFAGDISSISPDDIQSMSILKDAASTALYGAKASNGVVMIQTKTGRQGKVVFDVKITQGITFRAVPEYDKLGSEDWYEMAWESQRNRRYFTNKDTMPVADAYATDAAFNSNINSWYNTLEDSTTGKQMADADVFVKGTWDGYDDQTWTKGTLNPNARVMEGYKDDQDWLAATSGIGYRQNYSISASGGTEKTSYFTSVGYLDEEGFLDRTSSDRLNVRGKIDVRPTTWLKLGTNFSFSRSNTEMPFSDSSSAAGNPWNTSRGMAPIYPIYLHDQFTGEYIYDDNGDKIWDVGNGYSDPNDSSIQLSRPRSVSANRNIGYEMEHDLGSTTKTTNNVMAYAEITFLKDFKFTVDGSLDIATKRYKRYRNPIIGDGLGAKGSVEDNINEYNSMNFKQMLEWDRSFGQHSVNVLLGHENYSRRRNYLEGKKNIEVFPGSVELDNFAAMDEIVGYESDYRSEGYFARANYNYDEKYYFTASFRRDGSSKFAPDNRWGNFGSVGASWIISSEEFMANTMWIDYLKVRASYGTNGNDGGFGSSYVGWFAWMPTYETGNYSGVPAVLIDETGAPDLKWETSGAIDVGVDFRFFNRLNGTVGYFNKFSDELIFEVPVSYSTGVEEIIQNVGSMSNRGVELALDVDVIRNRDWVWNVGVNMTWLQNEITKLPGYAAKTGIIDGSRKLMEGESIYNWFLPIWGGIDPTDGATYYVLDPEKAGVGEELEIGGKLYTKTVGNAYRDFCGDGLSPISGALTSSLTWKNLTLDLLFTYRIGGKALDSSYNGLRKAGVNSAWSSDMLNSWRKPGDISSLPRIESSNSNLYATSSNTLIDNSYFAIQNVTLSYTFPKKIANKLTLSGLSVYVSGENLFQTSAVNGYDALSSVSGYVSNSRFASMATVSLGINVSF